MLHVKLLEPYLEGAYQEQSKERVGVPFFHLRDKIRNER